MPELRDLTASPGDRGLLRRFYRGLYVREFPDPDERESLANMAEYLRLKAAGWYGRSNYHIVLALDAAGAPVAGSISDYLADANAGVIEFLVVAAERRIGGLGRRLLDHTERLLTTDAAASGRAILGCIIAEIEDPARRDLPDATLAPDIRAAIWAKWGYRALDFPYVQPALSAGQKPVDHLLLGCKALDPEFQDGLPAATVKAILHDYLRLAMRIERPEDCAEYRAMTEHLDRVGHVSFRPLAARPRDQPRSDGCRS